ncbi:MAG: glycosyltransferase family 4 protein [Anaerolineae bacterium]|nr:glycosyltransferase family 4 protein [Anaerolineae bacterium]
MRVALLAPDFAAAYGWARYALDLGRSLSAQGVEVVALAQTGGTVDPGLGALLVERTLPRLVPARRGFLIRSLLAVPRVRRAAKGCDLVHVLAEPYAPLGLWSAGARPLVVTAHGTFVPTTAARALAGPLYRRAYRRARLIAVSDYTAGRVRAALPGLEPVVIRNGVDAARFQAPQPDPGKQGLTVLASGGVKARKGTHLLVEAFAQVHAQLPDARLIVTGRADEPEYLARVETLIAQHALGGRVRLAGMIPETELLGWYRHADVFALPSLNVGGKFEGFGLVFLEASAAGLPVVGTRGSGVEEAVIDGETGLLVPQDDPGALASAILRLLRDPALRVRLGAAGRAHAARQDWTAIATRVRDVYARPAGPLP